MRTSNHALSSPTLLEAVMFPSLKVTNIATFDTKQREMPGDVVIMRGTVATKDIVCIG